MTEPRNDRYSWRMVEPGQPLVWTEGAGRAPGAGEAVVEIAGCGVCHTDLGFLDGDVKTRGELPLVLGHEISGTVLEAGDGATEWIGSDVLVLAVIACGTCEPCSSGRPNVCTDQMLPGNNIDGGFATHVTVPANALSVIKNVPAGHELADLSVVADAVTTPLQAVTRAEVADGDFVVVIGAGGIGTFAAQIAAARGASVVVVDIDDTRLAPLLENGAVGAVNATGLSPYDVREQVREHAKNLGASRIGWKIFECSGTPSGQETAYGLLVPAATLSVVGFTPKKVTIRLSNLMAFDARAIGNWGCAPALYPEAIELVTSGQVKLLPFTRKVPMSEINAVLDEARQGSDPRRPILIP